MQVPKCLWNSCLGSLDCSLISLYDIRTWSYASYCLKVLEAFQFENLKSGKLFCSTLPYPFQSHTHEIQTHSNPMHCELAQV